MRLVGVTSKTRGFTLIELLISLSLLSLTIVAGNYVYLQLIGRWDKELGSFKADAIIAKRLYQLDRVVSGIIPYALIDEQGKPKFLFIGGERTILAVTSNGLVTGKTEVFRLSTVKKPSDKFDLIYQSISLQRIVLKSAEQNIEFENKVVLLTDVNSSSFDYFGWADLSLQAAKLPGSEPKWYQQYSALERITMPIQVRLSINGILLLASLDKKPDRWLGYYKVNK